MDQYQAVRNILRDVTYKPGWRFQARPPITPGAGVAIALVAEVPDVGNPERPVEVGATRHLGPMLEGEGIEREVLWTVEALIQSIESHERDEYLKVRGDPVHPPHHPFTA